MDYAFKMLIECFLIIVIIVFGIKFLIQWFCQIKYKNEYKHHAINTIKLIEYLAYGINFIFLMFTLLLNINRYIQIDIVSNYINNNINILLFVDIIIGLVYSYLTFIECKFKIQSQQ